jgi:hypothetical protein
MSYGKICGAKILRVKAKSAWKINGQEHLQSEVKATGSEHGETINKNILLLIIIQYI